MKNNKNESMYPRYSKITLKSILSNIKFLFFLTLVLSLLSIKKFPTSEIVMGNIALWALSFIDSFFLHIEHYSLTSNSVIVKKFFLKKEIALPHKINLVITKATLAYLSKGNTIYDSQITENCYMVCIVDYVSGEDFQKIISRSRIQRKNRYRDDALKIILKNNTYCKFLYSFVCETEQMQKLVEKHDCQIILPKSLEGKVDLSSINAPIFVDEEG